MTPFHGLQKTRLKFTLPDIYRHSKNKFVLQNHHIQYKKNSLCPKLLFWLCQPDGNLRGPAVLFFPLIEMLITD